MILLDTDIVIAHLKGNPRVTEPILDQLSEIAIPAIALAELDFGAKASARQTENLERLYTFVRAVRVIPFDEQCATEHGTLKAELRRLGRPTGAIDALIAATALTHGATLVTHNTGDYVNIPRLRLEDWLA
jgi:tRNA(fMet)-specific endonuclease VapC